MSAGFSALVAFRDIEQATITRLLASLGESQGDSAHTSPDTPESPPEIFLDNIYHISYSVQADDINPHSDFG